ncbi:MAG: NAD(P)-dependent oxidoreductase [Alphaproteobacteria bacterium]|jgi:nucleoside-diphosphate-sugar epimerase|nr:NAD(P)-dependent oxidoreductase [Alphaproteobacteria bacterium]
MTDTAVLVTGAAGLIGFTLAARLHRCGRAVIGMDRVEPGEDYDFPFIAADLSDVHKLYEALDRGAGGIIHCGAVSGPMLLTDNPRAIVESNLVGSANIFEAARQRKLRRTVYCSSTSAYGENPEGLEICSEAVALNAVDVYGATKAGGDILARAYAAQHGLDAVALRFSWVYGPRRRTECLIREMLQDALQGRTGRHAFGPGFARQYVYIEDVVDACIAAYDSADVGARAFNITAGTRSSFDDLAAAVRAVLPGAEITNQGGEGADLHHAPMDISAARETLGWRPQWPLEKGMRAYAEWLGSHDF